MRHSCNKDVMNKRIKEEISRAALLAQLPGQGARVCNAVIRAEVIAGYAAVN